MKGINNILKPLYDLWHKVMDKFSVKGDTVELNGKDIQVAFDVNSITSMTDEQLDSLKVGDVVRKITGNERHCYVVSYKEEKHGICLSYFAAGYTETVSYDYVTDHWVYNSTDVVLIEPAHTDDEIKELAKDEVESSSVGTIADVLGLDSGGNLIKGTLPSGLALYEHSIELLHSVKPIDVFFHVINTRQSGYGWGSASDLFDYLKTLPNGYKILFNGRTTLSVGGATQVSKSGGVLEKANDTDVLNIVAFTDAGSKEYDSIDLTAPSDYSMYDVPRAL